MPFFITGTNVSDFSANLRSFDEKTQRIVLSLLDDPKNIVPSHNEPYPSNFTLGESKGDFRIVDWEYSGNNNRYWDLAFLSVTSQLTEKQDLLLLNQYFKDKLDNDIILKFHLFKVVVQFTLIVWMATGLGKCGYAVDCDVARLKKVKSYLQRSVDFISAWRFYFPLKQVFKGKQVNGIDHDKQIWAEEKDKPSLTY